MKELNHLFNLSPIFTFKVPTIPDILRPNSDFFSLTTSNVA